MNMFKRSIGLILLVCMMIGCFCGCEDSSAAQSDPITESTAPSGTQTQPSETEPQQTEPAEIVDYAAAVQLDMDSETAKQVVSIKQFIDGDTTHFYVPSSVVSTGVLKARYLAINTPESTGKIEEYGKAASAFTKEKLSAATSIIVESDTASWEADSTGDRYLAWIWYRTDESEPYRNLNIEILQNGLAIANNAAGNRYGDTCMAAIDQAKRQKLNVYSGEPDPDFYYGEAVELTLKELRTNIEDYTGITVAFNGVVTMNNSNTVYVESYDPETDMYYGMAVYYGFNLNGAGLDIIKVGNEVRIVGSVQYYEAGGTYQVSDLDYSMMRPDDPDNIQKLSEGHSGAFVPTTADKFVNGTVIIETEEGSYEADYDAMAMNTTIEMSGLKVVDTYTTSKEDSASKGAFTLTCKVDGITVSVRTTVLYDSDGNLITADAYMGKTITVRGIVDYFNGSYQIKVFSADNIIITE